MKYFYRIAAALIACLLMMSLVACGESASAGDNKITQDNNAPAGAANEDYFEWRGDYISGLTSKGLKQTKLVIPARCIGFYFMGSYPGFVESKVEEVYFESDKDIELGGAFCCVETLKKIVLPAELTTIGLMEFSACKSLEEITIPAGVAEIGDMAFQRATALETVVFEGDVTYIGYSAFDSCKALKNIVLPDSITEIAGSAFNGCENLTEINLPKSLSVLNEFVFLNTGVTCVRVPAELEFTHVDLSAFGRIGDTIDVYVVEGSWADLNFEDSFVDCCIKKYQ
jgi:hypothetical protein